MHLVFIRVNTKRQVAWFLWFLQLGAFNTTCTTACGEAPKEAPSQRAFRVMTLHDACAGGTSQVLTVASRWCITGRDNLQQVDKMSMMRSTVGGHPSLQMTMWSLCGNALWRIIASKLWNSAVISRRFPAPCCTKLSWSTCSSENCVPGVCRSN